MKDMMRMLGRSLMLGRLMLSRLLLARLMLARLLLVRRLRAVKGKRMSGDVGLLEDEEQVVVLVVVVLVGVVVVGVVVVVVLVGVVVVVVLFGVVVVAVVLVAVVLECPNNRQSRVTTPQITMPMSYRHSLHIAPLVSTSPGLFYGMP